MNVLDYLHKFKDTSFEVMGFNELDALICSILSYYPFHLQDTKKVMKAKDLTKLLYSTDERGLSQRKRNDIKLMLEFATSKRYQGFKLINFKRVFDKDATVQFQAITILFKKFMFVSFCGTDATLNGWKEDFNMSYLEMVPSERVAIDYVNTVRKSHPFRPLYLGGHSKGGRLAITGAKYLSKKKGLLQVFSFDGPNFLDSFYDDKYYEIKSHIYKYTPNESIIGRLINDNGKDKIIVLSNSELLGQHDIYSWEVENAHFILEKEYTKRSNKIVGIINTSLRFIPDDKKKKVIDTLFDLLSRTDFNVFTDDKIDRDLLKQFIPILKEEWKATPKDGREAIKDAAKTAVKGFISKVASKRKNKSIE